MTTQEVLQNLNIGLGVAEQEDELAAYFVETSQWRRVLQGEVDIIYGPKGSGKSALYTLLTTQPASGSGHAIIPADKPRGTTAFKKVETNPPTSETEFQGLWKLYFAALVGNYLATNPAYARQKNSNELISLLREEQLIHASKETILTRILSWLSRRRVAIQGGLSFPTEAGAVQAEGKIILDEGRVSDTTGKISVNEIIEKAEMALGETGQKAWIAIDRLDVAFIDNEELEENALRALFHVYLDLQPYDHIRLKIFLRTDIWQRLINRRSFPEASHIVRQSTITWSEEQLLNLIVRRLLNNQPIVDHYRLQKEEVLSDLSQQREVFDKIFPKQVDPGEKRPPTLSWMLTRTADGTGQTAPRELIQLLNQAREEQLRNAEIGDSDIRGQALFGGNAIKRALDHVSRQRLNQTIYPEYPALKPFIEKLEGQKAEHTNDTLAALWETTTEEAQKIITRLVDIGFFEKKRASGGERSLWIPFLYRPALQIVQGSAEK